MIFAFLWLVFGMMIASLIMGLWAVAAVLFVMWVGLIVISRER